MKKKRITTETDAPVLFHQATKEQILEFFTEEMKGMYWSEQYLYSVLYDLRYHINCPLLQCAAIKLLQQSKDHALVLREIFQLLHRTAQVSKCEAIEQLGIEYQSIIFSNPNPTMQRDVCLVFVIQKILHFKIGVYSSLVQFATLLDNKEVSVLVNRIFREEKGIDLLLASIAEQTLLFEVISEVD